MSNTTPPADSAADLRAQLGAAAAGDESVAKAEALDEVLREASAAEKAWRPCHNAIMARRIGRFEDELKRHSVKPSSPR